MRAIVIYGTAVGILANLKPFNRPREVVERVPPSVMVVQNMLHVPSIRNAVDEMFRNSMGNVHSKSFLAQES